VEGVRRTKEHLGSTATQIRASVLVVRWVQNLEGGLKVLRMGRNGVKRIEAERSEAERNESGEERGGEERGGEERGGEGEVGM
jgi:hypothetical protein